MCVGNDKGGGGGKGCVLGKVGCGFGVKEKRPSGVGGVCGEGVCCGGGGGGRGYDSS